MFATVLARTRRWSWGKAISVGLHGILLATLLYRPEPIFVPPRPVQLGSGEKSYHVVYVPPDAGQTDRSEPSEHDKLAYRKVRRRPQAKPAPVKAKEAPEPNPQGEVAERNVHAGTVYGSIWALMQEGHDVKPAFPIVYPSPDFSRTDLPLGYQGDVIVEVTIERDGSVGDLKVIQGVSRGVDELAMAAVRNWRFRPAILDGSPIASKHDVHFHLPS
jgi:TonB family protein